MKAFMSGWARCECHKNMTDGSSHLSFPGITEAAFASLNGTLPGIGEAVLNDAGTFDLEQIGIVFVTDSLNPPISVCRTATGG